MTKQSEQPARARDEIEPLVGYIRRIGWREPSEEFDERQFVAEVVVDGSQSKWPSSIVWDKTPIELRPHTPAPPSAPDADLVYIETNRGLWRPGGCGYTAIFADAGQWPRAEAKRIIAELGPEKHARLIDAPPSAPAAAEVRDAMALAIHNARYAGPHGKREPDPFTDKSDREYVYRLTDAALSSLTAPASAASWQCAARKSNGPDTPADCDWPVCGCDPQADKVIAALEESGHLKSPHAGSAWRDGNTGASLGFVGGLLSIQRKDGSGRFVFPDDDGINPETDDETGRLLHVLKLDASELIAIRDFLNDYTLAPASAASFRDGVEAAAIAVDGFSQRADNGHPTGAAMARVFAEVATTIRALTPPAASQDSGAFDLRAFAVENRTRCEAPSGFNHPISSWSLSDWMTATLGELGEAANVAKKLNRVRDGIPGNSETPEQLRANLADEIADAFIYLDLLAQSEGIDLATAVRAKFDKTSAKIGYGK